jgi:hypothetical protein
MRNIYLIGTLTVISVFSFSCKKDYTCGCSYQFVDGFGVAHPETQIFDINSSTELNAKDACEGHKIVIKQESERVNVNCYLNERE